jgi:DNA-binding transcriptional ArsR family regulator
LGDERRLLIVERLCQSGPLSTASLNEAGRGVSRQGLTKHLAVLERAGLVDSFRVGRNRYWQVRPRQIDAILKSVEEMASQWETRLVRLKSFLEESDNVSDSRK